MGAAQVETESLSSPPEAAGGTSIGRVAAVGVVATWVVVALFVVVTLAWSNHVGVPVRDPAGRLFRNKLTGAVLLFLVLAAADVVVRTVRAGWSRAELRAQFEARWDVRRLSVLLAGIVGYHVVYICYRNMKSWDAFNAPKDHLLLSVDKKLFLGHSPAVLLHDLIGQGSGTAGFLARVYESFPQVLSLSIVAAPAFVTLTRRGLVMPVAGMWAWILGTVSYYAIPSLGPCYSAAAEFAGLPHTVITDNQAYYMQQRTEFLANPGNPSTFVSISAFASLHVGLTCMVMLLAAYYRKRVLTVVLAIYLVLVMVSTVYFGWHFVLDVVAGVVLAVLAVALGHLTVHPESLLRRRTGLQEPGGGATRG